MSDFTFPATGNVVVERGAVPVLVDCEPGGFGFDIDDADRRVTPKTKAAHGGRPVRPTGHVDRARRVGCQHGV